MVQRTSTSTHKPTVTHEPQITDTSKKEALTPTSKKYIPSRPAPPLPVKSLESRTVVTVPPETHLSPPPAETEMKKLLEEEVDHLLSTLPQAHTFKEKYDQLLTLRKQYGEDEKGKTTLALQLHERHPKLSPKQLARFQRAVHELLILHVKTLTKQAIDQAFEEAKTPVHQETVHLKPPQEEALTQLQAQQLSSGTPDGKSDLAKKTTASKATPATSSEFTATENMLINTASIEIIKQCVSAENTAKTSKQKLTLLKDLQTLYQRTTEGLDEDIQADIQASLANVARKYQLDNVQFAKLSHAVADKVLTHLERNAARLEWQMTREVNPERDGTQLAKKLSVCNTPEKLQSTIQAWTTEPFHPSPPEELVLRKHFQRVMSHQLMQEVILDKATGKKAAQKIASIASLIVQAEENVDMTKQILRSRCKSYPELMEHMGLPIYLNETSSTQGMQGATQQMSTAIDPLMVSIYTDIIQQANHQLATQLKVLLKNKNIPRGQERAAITRLLNLNACKTAHKNDLMIKYKAKLQQASPEEKSNLLREIENKVNDRAERVEALVYRTTLQALNRSQ